jgi:hypothetical protein
MMWTEIEAGMTAMRHETFSREFGSMCVTIVRAIESTDIRYIRISPVGVHKKVTLRVFHSRAIAAEEEK